MLPDLERGHRSVEHVPFPRIVEAQIQRALRAGDLAIESAGQEGQSQFDNVRHPDGVQQEIYRQMEVNAKRQASWSAPQAPVAGASIPEQIEQLAELRDKGHISPQEYEAKKAALLERM